MKSCVIGGGVRVPKEPEDESGESLRPRAILSHGLFCTLRTCVG